MMENTFLLSSLRRAAGDPACRPRTAEGVETHAIVHLLPEGSSHAANPIAPRHEVSLAPPRLGDEVRIPERRPSSPTCLQRSWARTLTAGVGPEGHPRPVSS